MVKVSVVGATGYVGVELVRLLSRHPDVRIVSVTSESHRGQPLGDVYPHLGRTDDLVLGESADGLAVGADVVFLALPHGLAMSLAPQALAAGARVIDLGADFRLRDPAAYSHWYEVAHSCPELLAEAVYGLPELRRAEIAEARLLANPGCYPTAAILGLAPLLAAGWARQDGIVIDAKSGVSGAGRSPSLRVHFAEVNENLRPYGAGGKHRHLPEIEQELSRLAGAGVTVSFTPHLVPMTRGILCTMYVALQEERSAAEVWDLYAEFYRGEEFVRVLPPGRLPETKFALGSNLCFIGLALDEGARRLVVFSAIDNLVKGAAGQAIQNMNIMCGLPETAGLAAPAIYP